MPSEDRARQGLSSSEGTEGRPTWGRGSAKRVRHVVSLKLDRLFRDAVDALNQTRAWDRVGIALHPVDMGGQTLNTATAMGRMFLTMTAAFAELERNLIAERTQAALLYKKSKRLVYGAIPYGYSRYGDALKVVEAEFGMVGKIQEWRARGWTLRKIADALNGRRIRTKHDRRWHASTVRSDPTKLGPQKLSPVFRTEAFLLLRARVARVQDVSGPSRMRGNTGAVARRPNSEFG